MNVTRGQNFALTSPNFASSGSYPAGCNCRWKLSTVSGYALQFNFVFFYTAVGDTLRIASTNGNTIQTCSGVGCANVNSTSNIVIVTFVSSHSSIGFSATVTPIQTALCNCGLLNRFTTKSLTISSPGYNSGGFNGVCV